MRAVAVVVPNANSSGRVQRMGGRFRFARVVSDNDFEVLAAPGGALLYSGGPEALAFADRFNQREVEFPIGIKAVVHQKCTKPARKPRLVHNQSVKLLGKTRQFHIN